MSGQLLHHHRTKLETESNIDSDVIAERVYLSVTPDDPHLESFAEYQRASGTLITVCPPDSSNGRYMLRRDIDRKRRDGSSAKYEMAEGQKHRLDVHPRNRRYLQDVSKPGWVVEGIKKGDSVTSAGCFAISLGGVDCFKTSECLADWELIELCGRTMIICFDADAATNKNVAGARDRLAAFLTDRGARVVILHLPWGPNGEKGIDDHRASGADLVDLLANYGEPWRPPDSPCARHDCQQNRTHAAHNAATLELVRAILSDKTKKMGNKAAFLVTWLEASANPGRRWDNQRSLAENAGLKPETYRASIKPFTVGDTSPIIKIEEREEITTAEYIRRGNTPPARPFPQDRISVPRVRYDLRFTDDQETLRAYRKVVLPEKEKKKPVEKPSCLHLKTHTAQIERDVCDRCGDVIAERPIEPAFRDAIFSPVRDNGAPAASPVLPPPSPLTINTKKSCVGELPAPQQEDVPIGRCKACGGPSPRWRTPCTACVGQLAPPAATAGAS